MRSVLLISYIMIGTTASADLIKLTHSPQQRRTYIANALISFRQTPKNEIELGNQSLLEEGIDVCHSKSGDLKAVCLINRAKSFCKRLSEEKKVKCGHYMDVLVTNRLGENDFIGIGTRYEIMKSNKNFEAEYRNELKLRYAGIATEFALSPHFKCPRSTSNCLAEGFDKYCLSSADKRGLTWQSCVSGLIWFVGTHKDSP